MSRHITITLTVKEMEAVESACLNLSMDIGDTPGDQWMLAAQRVIKKMHKAPLRQIMRWTPMQQVSNRGFRINGKPLHWRALHKLGVTKRKAKAAIDATINDEIWMNDIYQVNLCRRTGPGWFDATEECYSGSPEENGEVAWLSIKRIDREPNHDWRDLQRIKNDICGPESEAIEIYPAESRLMDTSNQYHLFVFQHQIPIGFQGRAVRTPEWAEKFGAKQREI